MTEEEALAAIEAGIDSVKKCKEDGVTLLATGEMGIGNTTTSSAVAAALLNCETAAITGKGAGLSDAGLLHKIAVIDEARKKYQFDSKDVFRILCSVGGLDIAGLCGVCIGGAVYGVPVGQEDGMDTVDANICLGHLADERDYGVGAQILRELGVHKMRLLTNNPVKRVGLEAYGLEIVENVPVETVPNPYNERYLRTKKERMGHTLHFNK